MSIARQAVRSAIFYTLAGYGSQVISFGSSLILLRLLTPAHYGVFGLAVVLVSVFSRAKVWGLNQLVMAETDPDDALISTQFWLSILLSLFVVVLVALARPLLLLIYPAREVGLAVWIALIAVFEADGVASTPETMLRCELHYGVISLLQFVSITLSVVVTVLLAWAGFKQWALVGGYATKTLSYCIGVWIYAPRRPRFLFSWDAARTLMGQGRKLLWGGLGSYLAFQYDDLAVGTLAGNAMLGLYRKAYDWSLLPTSIIGGVLGVAAAAYAKVKDDRAALSEATNSLLGITAMVALPASVGLAVISREFILTLFPPAWLPAAPMLQLLVVYSLMRPLKESFSGLATALKRNHVVRNIGMVQSVVMLISCTVLTLLWGANGAAVSAGLTMIAGFIVLYRGVLRDALDVNYWAALGMPSIATLAAALITLLAASQFLPDAPWLALLYKGGIFSAVYGIVMLLTSRDKLLQLLGLVVQSMRGSPAAAASS